MPKTSERVAKPLKRALVLARCYLQYKLQTECKLYAKQIRGGVDILIYYNRDQHSYYTLKSALS